MRKCHSVIFYHATPFVGFDLMFLIVSVALKRMSNSLESVGIEEVFSNLYAPNNL